MTVEEFLIVIEKMGYDPYDLARHIVDIASKIPDVGKEKGSSQYDQTLFLPTQGNQTKPSTNFQRRTILLGETE